MNNTATISLKEYQELKDIEKAYNEKAITYHGSFYYYRTVQPNEAIEALSNTIEDLKEKNRKLKQRNLIQRILNK